MATMPAALLDSGAACNECSSGYAGEHADRCSKSTARRCVLCFRPHHTKGSTCILCNRTTRAVFERYVASPDE